MPLNVTYSPFVSHQMPSITRDLQQFQPNAPPDAIDQTKLRTTAWNAEPSRLLIFIYELEIHLLLFTYQKQAFTVNVTKQAADNKIYAKQNVHTSDNNSVIAGSSGQYKVGKMLLQQATDRFGYMQGIWYQ